MIDPSGEGCPVPKDGALYKARPLIAPKGRKPQKREDGITMNTAYDLAKQKYAALGVDTEKALDRKSVV